MIVKPDSFMISGTKYAGPPTFSGLMPITATRDTLLTTRAMRLPIVHDQRAPLVRFCR